MARSLTFQHENSSFKAALHKVDRPQLYGSVDVITQDAEGRPCTMATLASDGRTLIPTGGTALGYLNTEGEWISRDQLHPVSPSGDALEEVASSFDAPVQLDRRVDTTALLDHSVRLTYRLGIDVPLPEAFQAALDEGAIFCFGFSYRGGVGLDPAFVFSAGKTLWLLVTDANDVQYVSLEQAGLCGGLPCADETDDEDDDAIDFGML